jgi:hypothetical protein
MQTFDIKKLIAEARKIQREAKKLDPENYDAQDYQACAAAAFERVYPGQCFEGPEFDDAVQEVEWGVQ